jgi:hypothetical protein
LKGQTVKWSVGSNSLIQTTKCAGFEKDKIEEIDNCGKHQQHRPDIDSQA